VALRRTTAAALGVALLGAVALPASAARCDVIQVETLTPHVPPPPAALARGRALALPVSVTRLEGSTPVAAPDVTVHVGLAGGLGDTYWGAYDTVTTSGDGTATARLLVPREARGQGVLDVEVVKVVVDAPCAGVEEHGRVTGPWSRAR
jgi:hypothetical protein